MQPNFKVLRKVDACVDDRHLKIMAEFDLGEPNFEVLRKVSACDDDRHFSNTLQFPHALKGHSPAIIAVAVSTAGVRRSRRFDSWSASQSPFRHLEAEFRGFAQSECLR